MALNRAKLIRMLDVAFDRDDVRGEYEDFLDEAMNQLSHDNSWNCLRTSDEVTMLAGTRRIKLPDDFISLTSLKSPITAKSSTGDRAFPCTVTDKAMLERIEASYLYPVSFSTAVEHSSYPVFLVPEGDGLNDGTFLEVMHDLTAPIIFNVSYHRRAPYLRDETDTNVLCVKFPMLVKSKLKQIAFEYVNDPQGDVEGQKYAYWLQRARAVDEYERVKGRNNYMGGSTKGR